MTGNTLNISDIIIQNPGVNSFGDLKAIIHEYASGQVVFMNFDVKPDYRDTPRNWQWQLEEAFCRIQKKAGN